MPRKHKRKLGSREYKKFKNYTEETLQNALEDIESQTLSMRQAATRYITFQLRHSAASGTVNMLKKVGAKMC